MIGDLLILPDGRELRAGAGEAVAIVSVTLTRQSNAAQELDLGCACAAMLEVQLLDTTGSFTLPEGTALDHYRVDGEGQRLYMGRFYAQKPQRPGLHTLTFTAYDAMILAEKDMTAFLAGLTGWPYEMGMLLEMVCRECGLPISDGVDLCNGSYPVAQFATSLTARQLIAWVAGANGSFARINSRGELEFCGYERNERPITPRDRKSLTLGEVACAPIDRVAVRQQATDVGVVWPAEGNETYAITANPLLTTFSEEVLLPCVQRLHRRLDGFSYTPFQAEVFVEGLDCPWQPGQIVTVDGVSCAVFSVTLRQGAAVLESVGQPSRDSAAARYSRDKVTLLQGQMTRVEMDISGIRADVSRVETDFEGLSVGSVNKIRGSQTLEDESYYFQSGAASQAENTVSGKALRIEDADPQSHELRIKAGEAVGVIRYGKNLIPYPYYYASTTVDGVTFTDNGDGTVTANGTANGRSVFYLNVAATAIALPAGVTFTLSGTPESGGKDLCFIQGTDSATYPTDFGGGKSFVSQGNPFRFYIVVESGVTLENVVFKPQLELGNVPTEFESYCADRATAVGGEVTGLMSLYPCMTLFSDPPGTVLEVTYRRIAPRSTVVDTDPTGEQSPMARFTVGALPEGYCLPGLMEQGQRYTLSFWARGEGKLLIEGQEFVLEEAWRCYTHSFIPDREDLVLEFGAVGTYDIFHPQLERGSLATDWSAAPEDTQTLILATREQMSALQVAADKISAEVTQVQTLAQADSQLLQQEVQSLKNQVAAAVTPKQLELSISTALEEGSRKVVTSTGYVFDENGLRISTTRSDMENLLDHRGMRVSRGDEVILRADAEGVSARDVTVGNYLVVGSHARFEDHATGRTACFWL